jgi:hypothetical protein
MIAAGRRGRAGGRFPKLPGRLPTGPPATLELSHISLFIQFPVLSLHEKPSRPCNQTPLMLVALSNMPL